MELRKATLGGSDGSGSSVYSHQSVVHSSCCCITPITPSHLFLSSLAFWETKVEHHPAGNLTYLYIFTHTPTLTLT